MAAIYLIRHGQASFGSADYDHLSEKGFKQAELLGEFWQQLVTPDKFYAGDLLRHGQTLSSFSKGYQQSNTSTTIHSGFNEFDHVDILKNYKTKWQNFNVMNDEMHKQKDPKKALQKEFGQALKQWISGDVDEKYKESWTQFKKRCVNALLDVIKQELKNNKQFGTGAGKAKNILVFTSGGAISVIVQHILALNDQQVSQVIQQSKNTSVTKILFSEDRLSVDYLNNYSHLERAGADWVTSR